MPARPSECAKPLPAETSSEKPLLRALHGAVQKPPPFWLMRQAGRYLPEYRRLRERTGGFLELCYTPELAVEATLQPVRRFATDGAILFSDILVIADGLGVGLDFRENVGPCLEPVRSAGDVARLRREGLGERLRPVYEAVGGVAGELPPMVTLIGFAGAPWTVATYMVEGGTSRDFAAVKGWAINDPDGFGRLIDVLVEATAAHLIAQVRAGAEAVQLFDSWAGVVPAGAFRRWVIAPTRAVIDRLRAACPDVPVIGFARGAGTMLEAYTVETGIDAVGLDSGAEPAWAARALQPRAAVQGNLDPVYLLAGGEAMTAEAGAIVEAFRAGAHVFNLGHGVLPQTPPEHVAALAASVRGRRP